MVYHRATLSSSHAASPLAFTAAITAGGQSRRFGSDKALAQWRGETLLWHAAQALASADQKILIAPAGRYDLAGWHTIGDTRPAQGPLAGLEAALWAAEYDWVAFAGVDVPTLTPAYWAALLNAMKHDALSVQATDPTGQPQPLGALYHRALLPHLSALLDNGERRLRLACPTERVVQVGNLPEHFFRNINTPQDLEHLP